MKPKKYCLGFFFLIFIANLSDNDPFVTDGSLFWNNSKEMGKSTIFLCQD